jgi:hypothetical protein
MCDDKNEAKEIEITPEMIEAGVSAWETWADSPPRILVVEVLRAALIANPCPKE